MKYSNVSGDTWKGTVWSDVASTTLAGRELASDMVITKKLRFETQDSGHVLDMTGEVVQSLDGIPISKGIVNVFVTGSTAGITVIEAEAGLLEDFKELMEKLIPQEMPYRHNRIDDNAHSHLRSSLLGPSLTVPLVEGKLYLGSWQHIVLADFDTPPRVREVVVQVVGG